MEKAAHNSDTTQAGESHEVSPHGKVMCTIANMSIKRNVLALNLRGLGFSSTFIMD